MAIIYNEKNKTFNLQTKNTSYIIGVIEDTVLLHLYYGKKIRAYNQDLYEIAVTRDAGAFCGSDFESNPYLRSEALAVEYPCYGHADLRTPAFHAEYENGSAITKLDYVDYRIFDGKKAIPGLPSTYAENDGEVQTLEITLRDALTGLEVILSYSVFEDFDAIAKSVKIKNLTGQNVRLKSAISSTTYVFDKRFEFVHLAGAWARERHIQRVPLTSGNISVDSKRVSSSHQHSPFMALARPETTENAGEVYGYSLVYSGNFIAQADVGAYDLTRLNMGINPFGFNWLLEDGEEFCTPEVISVYSANGFGEMSRSFHRLYRNRLCRGKWRDIERPVLINNWEATYFDFDEEKILNIAKKAQSLGVELMVLDDGWFGKRDDDTNSLGDWVADRRKLPGGIDALAKKVTELGMKFGLWFEPEMVSEDSDLYRAHPDWCIHVEGRRRTPSRQQLVLDLSRDDVCDYIVDAVSKVLGSAPISYVKWDMNRNITEIGSAKLPAERQQELPHRYMLGLYSVLERLTGMFPDVLFEGCSGGGGRFDAGMLPYFPQYWTSDDTDAIERLYIQHGTSMVMPSCTMGAHVSAVPNHQIGRTTSMKTRGNVAMMGQFGYELDLSTLSDEDIAEVRNQIETYKKIRTTVHRGDMYRLRSPFEGRNTAWEYVAEDKSRVVLMYCTIMGKVQAELTRVRFEGLDADAKYRDTETGTVYDADFLMNRGLFFDDNHDFESRLMIFERV